jgi:hypothetical protein
LSSVVSSLVLHWRAPSVAVLLAARQVRNFRLGLSDHGGRSRVGAECAIRVMTEGFACPNGACQYDGITDAQVHALVGDGKHGQAEQIQTFRGPACRTTFSARIHTPLYRLKTPSGQVALVLSALAEGLDLSAAERVFGIRHAIITSLSRAGGNARAVFARTLLPPAGDRACPTG